jgi:hypothetical protein
VTEAGPNWLLYISRGADQHSRTAQVPARVTDFLAALTPTSESEGSDDLEQEQRKPRSFVPGRTCALPSNTQGGSRVPLSGTLGFVPGALSNERPYRDQLNRPGVPLGHDAPVRRLEPQLQNFQPIRLWGIVPKTLDCQTLRREGVVLGLARQ